MNRIYSNRPLAPQQRQNNKKINTDTNNNFKGILQSRLEESKELKFSKHAKERLASRQIDLSRQDLAKLEQGVNKAEDKGSKESLVLINNNAYVVSVKNKTVITAMDQESMQENVFTNIDSAIVMG